MSMTTRSTGASMAAPSGGPPASGDALAVLRHRYEDRLAPLRENAADGRSGGSGGASIASGVVGVTGNAAPVELVLAAGKLPIQIPPEPPRPTPYADPWMEPEFEWEHRSLLDRTLRGDFEAL